MADRQQAQLGAIQETLFIPLAARARETRKKRPILRDPKAVHMVDSIDFDAAKYGRGTGGLVTLVRTATFDVWVRDFLARNPGGTVIEIGTGLNTRFERVDNGTVHWIDLDLPDTIELRRECAGWSSGTQSRRRTSASRGADPVQANRERKLTDVRTRNTEDNLSRHQPRNRHTEMAMVDASNATAVTQRTGIGETLLRAAG